MKANKEKYIGFYAGKNICSFIGYRASNTKAGMFVDQIWLTGSLGATGKATLKVNVLSADGNRKVFVGALGKATLERLLKKADNWIENELKPK